MPKIVWTPQADAQLLLLVLDQLDTANFVLDTAQLSTGMGPNFNKRSIQYRLATMRKKLDKGILPIAEESVTPPSNSPVKRKAGPSPSKASKKQKGQVDDDEENETVIRGIGNVKVKTSDHPVEEDEEILRVTRWGSPAPGM